MSSLHDCYPFDGNCKLSKDADLTLNFDDESSLKVPKSLLELASPVFKTAVQECRHDGTLHLKETSKDAWIFIINYLHPRGRREAFIDCTTSISSKMTIDLLSQCRKYDFEPSTWRS